MRALDEITIGEGRTSVVLSSCAVLVVMVIALAAVALTRFDYRTEHFADA